VKRYRRQLDALYKSALDDADKRRQRDELMAALRADYRLLKAERWGGFAGYDYWFAAANNASLGVQAAYNEMVGDFERLYREQGDDFERFYAEVARLAALPKDQRHAALRGMH
jgi:predicted aminopeptidase